MKTKVILWGLIIALLAAFAYVYVENPFQKEYDNHKLALAGLVFPASLILFEFLFRKHRSKREISILALLGLMIVYYIIFV